MRTAWSTLAPARLPSMVLMAAASKLLVEQDAGVDLAQRSVFDHYSPLRFMAVFRHLYTFTLASSRGEIHDPWG